MSNQSSRRIDNLSSGLLCLNIGFAMTFAAFICATGSYHPVYASRWMQEYLSGFQAFLDHVAPLRADQPLVMLHRSWIIRELLFIGMMSATAMVVFLPELILPRTAVLRGQSIRSLAGGTIVVGVPLSWLYLVKATGVGLAEPRTFWSTYGILFGGEFALVVCLLYLFRHRTIRLSRLVFFLHFVFWAVVVASQTGPPVIVSIPLSIIFPWSGLVWLKSGRGAA
jgi:hypothetical protein